MNKRNYAAGLTVVELFIALFVLTGLFYMFFGPVIEGSKTHKKQQAIAETAAKTAAAASPVAAYGVNTYLSCTRSSGNNEVSYCRDLTEVMAAKKGGDEFARQALQGVDSFLAKLKI